jgi:AcrR family transcriptional regulator
MEADLRFRLTPGTIVNDDSGCQRERGEIIVTDIVTPEERPLRADARRNRERILKSAREVFAECGSEAQIDDVARRAGVGVGTVYRHYPTKEALLTELVRQKFQRFADAARDALKRDGEPFEVLADLMRANAGALARDTATQQAFAGAGEQIWAAANPELEDLLGRTGELIDRAKLAGTIRADAVPTDIGMLMCGLSATMAHPAPGFDWHRHLDLVIDMLRAR